MTKVTSRSLLEQAPDLSVGVLSADLLRLGEELDSLEAAGVRLAHVDVMDGVFCPQLTVGPAFVKALPDRFLKDVHLMIVEPEKTAHAYVEAGAGIVTFHVEATRHPHRVLRSLAGAGVARGVALNPGTPVPALEPLLDELELVLLLAVDPGWTGQTFSASTEGRIREARTLTQGREIVVAVDGGVTKANVSAVAALDVDLVVAGSAIFDGTPVAESAREVLASVRRS
jgi:ribulose-phosphate 3-epimerase